MGDLCIATTSVPGDLPTKLRTIAAAGFTSVALHEPDFRGFAGRPQDVRDLVEDLGLTLAVLQSLHWFEGLTGPAKDAAFARLDHKLGLLRDLGCGTLMLGSNTDPAGSGDLDLIVSDLAVAADRAAEQGARIAMMALPWATHVQTEMQALDLVKAVDRPNFGLALNSFFSLASGQQAARLRDIPADRLFHVQLSDAPRMEFDISRLKSHFGLLPGQGDLNLSSFVRVLARAGYKGPWSVARVSATADASRDHVARDGYRALVSLLDEVAQTEPALPAPISGLPKRVTPTGVEFIEFAVDDATRPALTDLLRSLRFRRERQHMSKSVELWRQGAINLVINSETTGFAAQTRADHGPCVCDMGLRVRDAAQTVARATRLGAPEFAQPVGSGELDIPAIQGVGGSVVHFIDEQSDLHRVWDIEFAPVPTTRALQPAGLRRIDHVAQTMRYQDMQSWLTYYLSTFDMQKAPVVDVADPSGVVLSQALASPEGEVRLNLNGASERQTFAGAFLAQGFGAGVQHIAFLTDDIFETSDLLQETGFPRLQISANYYADLGVRFGLDADVVARLQAGNILYDQDGQGAYFQIYSAPIWGGFFFEIIQRKQGYPGYGARNAPIRLAAQLHHAKG